MRAHEIIDEIGKLPSSAFSGRYELGVARQPSELKPLPGSDRLMYSIEGSTADLEITVWDPRATPRRGRQVPEAVGQIAIGRTGREAPPFKDAAEVSYIAVDPQYRGQGIAQGMYQVLLQVLKRTLVAGEDQTPGGQRAWVTLWRTPGVEVQGWLRIDDSQVDNRVIDTLMGKLGADYIGMTQGDYRFFSFEVQSMASGRRMQAAVQTQLNKVYGRLSDNSPALEVGMYAVWVGK